MEYSTFLNTKSQLGGKYGFKPIYVPNFLFDFQQSLIEWSVEIGRCAILADCGLGKTPIQLVWAENIVRKENKPVLIITPLAVSNQTIREADKFSIQAERSNDGEPRKNITVTNYEQLHKFNADDYVGVVCDESSAIKQFGGVRRKQVIEFMRTVKYRLLCTATAAPNDYIELGTHSEALGALGQMDMLGRFFKSTDDMQHVFFKNGDFWDTHKWMFKAHAEIPFWRWVCSWARALRKPSDLGFSDDRFILPPLTVQQHVVKNDRLLPGELFPVAAKTLKEQRLERQITLKDRCEKVAQLVDTQKPALVWCHSNEEGDLLEQIIKDSKQVYGSQDDDIKGELLNGFALGQFRVLVTKPKIGAWGMNYQHCAHEVFFPSHSFEQYYQGVRRCWRFGQKRPVHVDVVTTDGEAGVTANLNRKSEAAERMFDNLVKEMNNVLHIHHEEKHIKEISLPVWL